MRQYFGTDGIRGKANQHPMTAEFMMRVAMATALLMREKNGGNSQNRALIGKDPRLSGYMLEQAIASGFEAMGMDVFFSGPMPTPAVAMLTRSMRADIGVMISASHNPFEDNGVKFFGADGYKLSDELQDKIEQKLSEDLTPFLAGPRDLGKAQRIDDAPGRYIEFLKSTFPRKKTLSGLKIVVDCANGAAYKIAPQILWELEADIISIGVSPNGMNINEKCGATDTKALQQAVIEHKADIGLALDGDADRLIMVDEKGQEIDGDQLMALLAVSLGCDTLVATVMSNLGLETYLQSQNIKMLRTPVGDRHVVEAMRKGGYTLGGEQSGHIVMGDHATTGDGLLAGLQILSILHERDEPASAVLNCFKPAPQILQNVEISASANPLKTDPVTNAIQHAETQLKQNGGRLLVRASGTQPLIRVMAEGDNKDHIKKIVSELCSVISKNAA